MGSAVGFYRVWDPIRPYRASEVAEDLAQPLNAALVAVVEVPVGDAPGVDELGAAQQLEMAITFMGSAPEDGVVDWHADGIPITEIIPLQISDDAAGGELTVFRGNYETGMARLARSEGFGDAEVVKFAHRMGHSTVAQLMRVLHCTSPMPTGSRVSLNLNLRSRDRPYVDDNPMYYLGADNPGFEWVDQYVADVRHRQLPAYLAGSSA